MGFEGRKYQMLTIPLRRKFHCNCRAGCQIERLERRQLLSVTFDLKSQWSDASNPNGPWQYRQGTTDLPHVANWQSTNNAAWAPSNNGGNFLPGQFRVTSGSAIIGPQFQAGDVGTHTTDIYNGQGEGPSNFLWTNPSTGGLSGPATISGSAWFGTNLTTRYQHYDLFLMHGATTTDLASGDITPSATRAKPITFSFNRDILAGDRVELQLTVAADTPDPNHYGTIVGVNLTIKDISKPLLDGGFESPVVPVGGFTRFATGQTIGGAWTVLGPAGNQAPVDLLQTKYTESANGVVFKSQEGLNSADLTGDANQGTTDGVKQAIPTVAGQAYQVSFFVGRAGGNNLYATPASVALSINGGARTTFTNSDLTPGTNNWKQFTKTFTATGSSTTLAFFNAQTTNNFTGLDNVVVTALTTGTINGTVFNDINGNGTINTGESGLAGVSVFLDTNHNGIHDAIEPLTTTSAAGTYSFGNLALGPYSVRAVLPTGFRSSGANPVSVSLAGASASANFELSQTAIISGNVFHDANGNKVKDAAEASQAGVVVYLDINNNGVLDFLDVKTTTDGSGNYQFVVPFGTYVVREVAPKGFAQDTATLTLTVKQAQISANDNIGNK